MATLAQQKSIKRKKERERREHGDPLRYVRADMKKAKAKEEEAKAKEEAVQKAPGEIIPGRTGELRGKERTEIDPTLLGAGGTASEFTAGDILDLIALGSGGVTVAKSLLKGGAQVALTTAGKEVGEEVLKRGGKEVGGRITQRVSTGISKGMFMETGKTTLTTQRGFIGKGGKTMVDKLFKTAPKTAKEGLRFATTTKSKRVTTSLLSKLGLSMGATSLFVTAVGSYPFAGFIKEEALQTLGMAFFTAEKNNDIKGMITADAKTDELLNAAPSIMDRIPFLNVLSELKGFFDAVRTKSIINKRSIEIRQSESAEQERKYWGIIRKEKLREEEKKEARRQSNP